ncbi:hypothetical protein ACQVPJ_26315 [Bacillus mycoides]|uniref:Uncharacterized protein n=1 Tax=Bacillus cereus VD021 TaxID=1053224 RepID=R8GY03_BACCE|nr:MULTISPECIES: hypothetical protein [Bacillus cereus group]EOO65497.1 hypothetical protein IIC_06107 [Bacillus cereus VD021]MED1406943.1 hypothetical protein [Bacillus mycoides]
MYPFVVDYEIPPMQGVLSVDVNAKDEYEARYIVSSFLTPGAKIRKVRGRILI